MARLTELRLRQYLLRDLPDREQEEVEAELFAEDYGAEQLSAAEDELIDAYVRNELSARERTLFETSFVTSSRIAQRVQIAGALLSHVAAESKIRARTSRRSWRSAFADMLRLPYAAPIAAVSLIVICAFSSLVGAFVSSSLLRREFDRSTARANENIRREMNDRQEQWKDAMAEMLAREKSAPQERGGPPAAAGAPPAVALFSFVLTPGAVRSAGMAGITQRLVAPHGPATVRLDLRVRDEQKYRMYNAVIRNAEQSQIWSGAVAGSRVPDPHLLGFTIPATILVPGEYSIELAGDPGSGAFDVIDNYFFAVVRK